MEKEFELRLLTTLANELDGECGNVCPASIRLMTMIADKWDCTDCLALFDKNPEQQRRMSYTGVENGWYCPCTALGEEALVRLNERIEELKEELE